MEFKKPNPTPGPADAAKGKAKPPPLPSASNLTEEPAPAVPASPLSQDSVLTEYQVQDADLLSQIVLEPFAPLAEPPALPVKPAADSRTASGGKAQQSPLPVALPAPPKVVQPPAAKVTPVTPEWKVLEPTDRNDPVEHDVCEHRPRDKRWAVLAASLRGKLHAHKAMWRDDAYQFAWVDDWTIIAMADGAGSARLARVGARVACEDAVKSVRDHLAGFRMSPAQGEVPTPADQEKLHKVLVEGALQARCGILREVNERQCLIRDLNTTFLLVVHAPFGANALVAALQVGDGAIGVYTADDDCKLVGVADHGQYSSETCFITTPGIEEQFAQRTHVSLFKKNIRGLAVLCDGVSDDFFPESKRLIELFSGNPVKELKTKQGEAVWGLMHKERGILKDPRNGQALLDWLRYEKRGSSDDRTLVLMYRRDQQ